MNLKIPEINVSLNKEELQNLKKAYQKWLNEVDVESLGPESKVFCKLYQALIKIESLEHGN